MNFPTCRGQCSWQVLQGEQALLGGQERCKRESVLSACCIFCPNYGSQTLQDLSEMKNGIKVNMKEKVNLLHILDQLWQPNSPGLIWEESESEEVGERVKISRGALSPHNAKTLEKCYWVTFSSSFIIMVRSSHI